MIQNSNPVCPPLKTHRFLSTCLLPIFHWLAFFYTFRCSCREGVHHLPRSHKPWQSKCQCQSVTAKYKLVWPASNPNGWDLFCLKILLLDLILVLFTVIFQIKSKIWFTLAFLETLTFFYSLKLFCEKWSSNLFLDYVDVNVLESVKFHPCQYPCSIFGFRSFTWSQ